MYQNLPLLVAQEVHDSSGVTPCIIMRNNGVLYHLVSSLSPERWTKVVLQERVVVGSVYLCHGGTAWCSITPSMAYATMNITFTAHCVERTFLEEENRDASINLIRVSNLVRMSEPRFRLL